MIELYGLAPNFRILFTSLLLIAITLQAVRLFMLISHQEHRITKPAIVFEILVLLHLILATMLIAITLFQRNIIAEYLYSYRYGDLILILSGLWMAVKDKKPDYLICSVLAVLTLPGWSLNIGKHLFIFVNSYFIIRTVILTELEWRKIRGSISRLSIKEAVDLLPGGILYANENGELLIVNPTMSRLLSALNIVTVKNTLSLWDSLMNIQDSYNVSVQVLEEKLLVRIRNAGSWLFSNDPITVRNKPYIQMLAIDITDEDVLTRELEESNNALKELGTELSLSISNIDQLEREREVLRMKTRIHDILGQRLSILSRLLESDMDSNNMIRSIKPLLTDLTKGLTSNIDKDPQELLSALTQSFALIGTVIHFKGCLPTNQQLAHVFTELIRECSTNAVRHGNASNVYAELQEDDKQYMFLVSNDGIPPTYPIIIGGGIEGMRRQVNEMAGELTIESEPEFHIRVTIPKNREGDFDD